MKSFICGLLAIASTNVLADYLVCRLKVGYDAQELVAEAEYRGRSIAVSSETFLCRGEIVGSNIVTTVTSTESGASRRVEARSFAVATINAPYQRGDGMDQAICKCGME